MLQLTIVRGSGTDWPLKAKNRGGATTPVFAADDLLSAPIWPGDDRPATFYAPVTWYTAGGTQTGYDQGQVLVSPTATLSAALAAGASYQLEVWWTSADGTRTECIARAAISVLPAPAVVPAAASFTATIGNGGVITAVTVDDGGTGHWPSTTMLPVTIGDSGGTGTGARATAASNSTGQVIAVQVVSGGTGYTAPTIAVGLVPETYCDLNDMTRQCSWIGQFADQESDQAGFLEQRIEARQWIDGLILRAAPVAGMGQLISRQNWWSWTTSGVDPRCGTSLAVDRVLAGYLASGCLVTTTPNGSAVVRACACYAIGLILRAQPGDENVRMAGRFRQQAQAEAANLVAEVDINGTGQAAYAIALGATNTRFG